MCSPESTVNNPHDSGKESRVAHCLPQRERMRWMKCIPTRARCPHPVVQSDLSIRFCDVDPAESPNWVKNASIRIESSCNYLNILYSAHAYY